MHRPEIAGGVWRAWSASGRWDAGRPPRRRRRDPKNAGPNTEHGGVAAERRPVKYETPAEIRRARWEADPRAAVFERGGDISTRSAAETLGAKSHRRGPTVGRLRLIPVDRMGGPPCFAPFATSLVVFSRFLDDISYTSGRVCERAAGPLR